MNRVLKNLRALTSGVSALRAYARGRDFCRHPPTALWIEPTNLCNLKCVMCEAQTSSEKRRGFMGMDAYRSLVDEVSPYVTTFYLFMGGESLLHNELEEMIRYARTQGIAVRLNTNATLLDQGKAKSLFSAGLDYISFSFDGYNARTYESIRIGSGFEPTLNNILDFLRLKKERRANKPYTVLETLVSRDERVHSEEEAAFRNMFRGLPLDEFNLRQFHSWRGQLVDKSTVPLRESGTNYAPCPYLWCALSIQWDGTVVPCCLDTGGGYPLGRIGDRPLLEIWNGNRMRALRSKMVAGRFREIPLCSDCDILWADRHTGKLPHTLLNVALSLPAANLAGYRCINRIKRSLRGEAVN